MVTLIIGIALGVIFTLIYLAAEIIIKNELQKLS
jgi:hypothetical protein